MKKSLSKTLYLSSVLKEVSSQDDDTLTIKGIASTSGQDRHGDVVLLEAWIRGGLDNYLKNPIMLYNHNYNMPIGKAVLVEVRDEGLYIEAEIYKAADERIFRLIKTGVLKTLSVGFLAKEVKYVPEMDGFIISVAELLENSVVTVPANTDAEFSVAKQLDSKTLETLKKGDEPQQGQDAEGTVDSSATEIEMTKEELEALVAKAVSDASTKTAAELTKAQQAAAEKAAAEKAAAEKAAAEKAAREDEIRTIVATVSDNTNKLVEDVEKRFNEKLESCNGDVNKALGELKGELETYGKQITQNREKKRLFSSGGSDDWQEKFAESIEDAFFLSRAAAGKSGQPKWDTRYAKSLMEKVNAHSGIEVSSEDFEQIVSTRVEREIQNNLILAPLFREIAMTSATQILPILPDSGYAQFTANQTASGSSPKGNLSQRGDAYGSPYGGVDLDERTLSTKKLITRTYLGNETEEDAILPILPLIRESMVRSHVRAVEAAILVGNHADGPFGTGGLSFPGLVAIAASDSHTNPTGVVGSYSLTAADLLGARKSMGKYGVRTNDVVYIVSQRGWFELIEDPEFQDANLVGIDNASKLRGEVGRVYGSPVLLCDEYAAPAAEKFHALAVNPSNYVVPRLRGVTMESDYETGEQRTVLVASQRLGFIDIFDGAHSVHALRYNDA